VPNREIDKGEGKFFTHWDQKRLTFWCAHPSVAASLPAAAVVAMSDTSASAAS
jgi:hypothetical protein